MKRCLAAVLCALLLLTATACSSNSAPIENSTQSSSGTTVSEPVLDSPSSSDSVSSSSEPSDFYMEEADYLWFTVLDMAFANDEMLEPSDYMMDCVMMLIESSVVEADEDSCKVWIRYPDAAALLMEAISDLPDDFDQYALDQMYFELSELLVNGQVEMLETTVELPIVRYEDGEARLELTTELAIAMTGGIAAIE